MKGKWTCLFTGLVLLALGVGPARGQEAGSIAGKVTRLDGAGLAGVTVVIDPLGRSAQTDATGSYVLDGVPAGTYEVTFSLSDHSTAESAIVVAAGATRTLDQKVDWDLSFAETITVFSVSRRAERITEAPAAVTVVPEEDIALKAPTGQVPKLLEFTPGVDFTQSGLYDFNFNIRGFNSSLNRRVLTLIDGRDPSVPFLGCAGVGGGLLPDGRAGDGGAGARTGLGALRRQRLQRRPQHDDAVAARERGGAGAGDRRRAGHGPRRPPVRRRAGRRLVRPADRRLPAERRLHPLAQPDGGVLDDLHLRRADQLPAAGSPAAGSRRGARSATAACASTATSRTTGR